MALPKAVEEQARIADELQQKLIGNTSQEAATDDKQQEAEVKSDAESQQAEAAPEQSSEQHKTDDDSWESRFKVIEGKYRNEVPRYAQEIRELKRQLQEIEKAKAAEPVKVESRIKPEEVEEYGVEFIDLVKRAAEEKVQELMPRIDQFASKVETLEARVSETSANDFEASLDSKEPKWREMNTDQNFLTWLAEIDPLSGSIRHDLLDAAVQRGDSDRAANFFKAYKGSAEQSWAKPPKDPLESQIAPTHSRADTPQTGKKIWTTGEVAKFYADARNQKISDTEFKRIEQDIFAAQQEGRLR